jgi:hypothetical protein
MRRSSIRLRRCPVMRSPGRRSHTAEADSADDNAVVEALATSDDSELAHLRAGEAASVVLLTATALGLACAITEPLEVLEPEDHVAHRPGNEQRPKR